MRLELLGRNGKSLLIFMNTLRKKCGKNDLFVDVFCQEDDDVILYECLKN